MNTEDYQKGFIDGSELTGRIAEEEIAELEKALEQKDKKITNYNK